MRHLFLTMTALALVLGTAPGQAQIRIGDIVIDKDGVHIGDGDVEVTGKGVEIGKGVIVIQDTDEDNTVPSRTTNKVRLCERSEPQSEPFVGQARRKC